MKFIAFIATLGLSVLLAASGCAAVEADHKAHHPAAASQVSKDNASTVVSVPQDANAKMDSQIKAMRDIHEKMMRATSTDERKKLKAEHSKAMQAGMVMMKDMPMMDEHSGQQDMKDMADMSAMKCDMKNEMACCKKDNSTLNTKDVMKCDTKEGMKCCMKGDMKSDMKCDMKDRMLVSMTAKHQMMEKRMEMMETMMQMMMDRMINDDYDAHQTSVKK